MGGSGHAPWEAPVRLLLIPLALAAGALWWWAVVRLTLTPGTSGPVEGAVAVGGWGLSLLPVHCARRARPEGGRGPRGPGSRITRASRRRRSAAGSGPS
ncbi:hypothetical protein [Streptomyces sp. NPDC012888]|uniref:hypothetical protein n=1 Tax=Streptomyces sp. NPDC012888 TaxID=3364855 RepID=UPI00367DF238